MQSKSHNSVTLRHRKKSNQARDNDMSTYNFSNMDFVHSILKFLGFEAGYATKEDIRKYLIKVYPIPAHSIGEELEKALQEFLDYKLLEKDEEDNILELTEKGKNFYFKAMDNKKTF